MTPAEFAEDRIHQHCHYIFSMRCGDYNVIIMMFIIQTKLDAEYYQLFTYIILLIFVLAFMN